jgi:hypothetical protein
MVIFSLAQMSSRARNCRLKLCPRFSFILWLVLDGKTRIKVRGCNFLLHPFVSYLQCWLLQF